MSELIFHLEECSAMPLFGRLVLDIRHYYRCGLMPTFLPEVAKIQFRIITSSVPNAQATFAM